MGGWPGPKNGVKARNIQKANSIHSVAKNDLEGTWAASGRRLKDGCLMGYAEKGRKGFETVHNFPALALCPAGVCLNCAQNEEGGALGRRRRYQH